MMTITAPHSSNGTIILTCYGLTNCIKMEKTYARLMSALQKAFPNYKVRLSISSDKIRSILQKQGRLYLSLSDILKEEKLNHTKNILVLNTCFLPGTENNSIADTVHLYSDSFSNLISTSPILSDNKTRNILLQEYSNVLLSLTKGKMQVLSIVHGSPFVLPSFLSELNSLQVCQKVPLTFLSMTSHPSVQDWVQIHHPQNELPILLTPFMLLSGRHTAKDIFGETEGTLQHFLLKSGYQTHVFPFELGTMNFFGDLLVKITKHYLSGC